MLATCQLGLDTTLPLVCICSLFSFLTGVGIGANDLSANFAMVVGSGSLDMKRAIIYCIVFELLGAAFMGGQVSNTIRNGIVLPTLFSLNRDVVIVGMTSATFAAALWLYLSTVFGLPVSITHTVVGSVLGFAIFSTWSFSYVKPSGLLVILLSWVLAPVAACVVTAALFHAIRRHVLKVKGRSFSLACAVLPYCLAASLLVDFFFIMIERPPVVTQVLTRFVPLSLIYTLFLFFIFLFCYVSYKVSLPRVIAEAQAASSFVWESPALRTEAAAPAEDESSAHKHAAVTNESIFRPPAEASADDAHAQLQAPPLASDGTSTSVVLDSITNRDSHIRRQRSVRLAPTARRSPLPSSNTSFALDAAMRPSFSRISYDNNARSTSSHHAPSHEQAPLLGADKGGSSVYGSSTNTNPLHECRSLHSAVVVMPSAAASPTVVREHDLFGEEDWCMDHPMEPINFSGLLIKPFNPRAEYLFTGLQVVAGSMSSFVHGAVAGANATATFVILYDVFTNHELGQRGLGSGWVVMPAMLGIAIGMCGLGATLMKTVGMELVTVTPVRGWCIQLGGTLVTMVLTGLGIPVSLSQSQVGAAIGCGMLDAKLKGVSWGLVGKIVGGWVVTLVVSAVTTGLAMWLLAFILC